MANLAASFSEAGSSVALIAADSFDLSLPKLVRGPVRGTSARDERARLGDSKRWPRILRRRRTELSSKAFPCS